MLLLETKPSDKCSSGVPGWQLIPLGKKKHCVWKNVWTFCSFQNGDFHTYLKHNFSFHMQPLILKKNKVWNVPNAGSIDQESSYAQRKISQGTLMPCKERTLTYPRPNKATVIHRPSILDSNGPYKSLQHNGHSQYEYYSML